MEEKREGQRKREREKEEGMECQSVRSTGQVGFRSVLAVIFFFSFFFVMMTLSLSMEFNGNR
jgi:hypothetical protein